MDEPLVGTTIGGYQILEEIGRGGMATVYRAQQISMDRAVAIKILPPQFLHQPTSLERFKQEASIVARLEHRAIVPVHDYGEYEGVPYLVMRFMDSGSVDQLLTVGPVPAEQTLAILQQIAPALDYAHREGVLHRDLKPSNILLDANGDAFITDFGIARILGSNPKPLTTSGVVGTPSYMSPEQAQGHELDGRSDVYALGVVLFEMLTGVRPFEGETPYSVAVKHVTEAPPLPCDLNPRLPRTVDRVLLKALAKNRDARYQTAADLTAALKTALEAPAVIDWSAEDDAEPDTSPSLNDALRASAPRAADSWRAAPPVAPPPPSPPVVVPPSRPSIEVMPAYAPSGTHSYTGSVVLPRRRPRTRQNPGWLTWATVALLTGGLILALTLIIAYYYVNSGGTESGGSLDSRYSATAIFKLTATRQAIEQASQPAATEPASAADGTPGPAAPPTNTPRPTSISMLTSAQQDAAAPPSEGSPAR